MLENREKPHRILAKPFIKSNIDNFVHSVGYNNAPFIIRIVNESEHLKSMQFYLCKNQSLASICLSSFKTIFGKNQYEH